MAENYFENIRIVGSSLDEGISRLQETWQMPNLLLCKNVEEDQLAAKKLIENLRNELRVLKDTIEKSKVAVSQLRETHTQFLEDSTRAIKNLKEEVDDIKILFAENGYVEDPMDNDLSILNSQLESLSVNSTNSLVKDSDNLSESSMCDSASFYESPTTMRHSADIGTPLTNNGSGDSAQCMSLNERPMEPLYSPYFCRMMKK